MGKPVRSPLSGNVRAWFDDGRGGCWIYGEILSRGNVYITVQWRATGRKQRVRIGSAAHDGIESVTPVTPRPEPSR